MFLFIFKAGRARFRSTPGRQAGRPSRPARVCSLWKSDQGRRRPWGRKAGREHHGVEGWSIGLGGVGGGRRGRVGPGGVGQQRQWQEGRCRGGAVAVVGRRDLACPVSCMDLDLICPVRCVDLDLERDLGGGGAAAATARGTSTHVPHSSLLTPHSTLHKCLTPRTPHSQNCLPVDLGLQAACRARPTHTRAAVAPAGSSHLTRHILSLLLQ